MHRTNRCFRSTGPHLDGRISVVYHTNLEIFRYQILHFHFRSQEAEDFCNLLLNIWTLWKFDIESIIWLEVRVRQINGKSCKHVLFVNFKKESIDTVAIFSFYFNIFINIPCHNSVQYFAILALHMFYFKINLNCLYHITRKRYISTGNFAQWMQLIVSVIISNYRYFSLQKKTATRAYSLV